MKLRRVFRFLHFFFFFLFIYTSIAKSKHSIDEWSAYKARSHRRKVQTRTCYISKVESGEDPINKHWRRTANRFWTCYKLAWYWEGRGTRSTCHLASPRGSRSLKRFLPFVRDTCKQSNETRSYISANKLVNFAPTVCVSTFVQKDLTQRRIWINRRTQLHQYFKYLWVFTLRVHLERRKEEHGMLQRHVWHSMHWHAV